MGLIGTDLSAATHAAITELERLEAVEAGAVQLQTEYDTLAATLEAANSTIGDLTARIKELEEQLPKPARKPVLGMFFRDGVAGEGGAGDGGAVTIAEMQRVNPNRKWVWRHYLQATGGIDARLQAAMQRGDPNYVSMHVPKDFAAVAAGQYDAQIRNFCRVVAKPLAEAGLLALFNIQHEPENDELAAVPNEAQRAARFVTMVKKVMVVMALEGVTPAYIEAKGGLWTWPALTEAYYRDGATRGLAWLAFPMDQFGNGPLAADLYNRYGSKNKDRSRTLGEKWQDFTGSPGSDMAGDFFALCKAMGKQGAILETAWHEDPRDPEFQKGREAAQFPKIVQAAKDGILVAYCRSNVDAKFSGEWYQHYRVNTTPETDAAFALMSRDPVWA